MPQIPNYLQITRKMPQVSGGIDTSAVGAGQQALGKGLMDVADVAGKLKERQSTNDFYKAQADMSVALTGESNAYDERPDYDKFEGEYSGNMQTKLGEVALTINDPDTRNKFIQSFRPKIEAGRQRVLDVAWGKEKDFNRGELSTRLETLHNSAILSGDINDANTQAQGLIQSHVDLGHVESDEAVGFKTTFRDGLSKGFLESMSPEKRVGALKQPWAKKHLAPDEYVVLRRNADKELREGQAQDQVDTYMSDLKVERADVMAKIDKKYSKDAKLRKEVETRFDYAFNKQQKAVSEHQSNLFDNYYLKVRTNELTVDDIPKDDLEALSPAQQSNLFTAQSNSVKGTKLRFNVGAEDKLNYLLATKDFQGLRKYYVENSATMSETQNKSWSKVSIDGLIAPEIESLFTIQSSLDSKTPSLTKEQRAPLKEKINEWYQNYQEVKGETPDEAMVNKRIDGMLMEYDTSWWWGGTKPQYELTDVEKDNTLAEAQEEDPRSFKDVEDWFKQEGIQPDHIQFMEAYRMTRDNRNVAQ